MHDDFSALDLLSMGGFRLSSSPKEAASGKKKRFVRHHRATGRIAKRGLTALLPMLGAKMRGPARSWSPAGMADHFVLADQGIQYTGIAVVRQHRPAGVIEQDDFGGIAGRFHQKSEFASIAIT